nr:type II restriction endonuclease [Sulfurovaceae bacterium]
MITQDNFKEVLNKLGFTESKNIYTKKFSEFNTELKVDFINEKLIYPEKDGLIISQKQTCNFSDNENFVVFECVTRLLNQGYNPKHIELEQTY